MQTIKVLPWQPNLPKNNINIKLVFIVLGKYNFVYRSIWKLVLIKIIQSKKRPQNISSFITTVGYIWSGKPCILVCFDRLVLHKCISEKKLRPIIYFFVTIKSDGLSSKLRKNNLGFFECFVLLLLLTPNSNSLLWSFLSFFAARVWAAKGQLNSERWPHKFILNLTDL